MNAWRDFSDPDELAPPTGDRSRVSDLFASVRELFRRRFITFALVTVAVLGLSLALISMISPKYDATTRVRIDPSRNPLASQRDSSSGLSDEAIDTEVTELSSPELAREVARRIDLSTYPEFRRVLDGLSENGQSVSHDQRVNALANAMLGGLDVRREKLTYIIAVRYRSRDPQQAAAIANAFAETYIATRVGGRSSTAQTQAAMLGKRVQELEAETRASETRAAQYRASTGIVQGGQLGTITDQQVAPISSQLASAQSEAAEARAKLAEARRQVAAGGLDAVSEVRSSPVIADLRRQRAEVLRNTGEITARYGPRHPETIKVTQQLEALDEQIRDEANRAIGTLRAEADAASARASSLSGTLTQLKSEQARNTSASAVAEGYERDAATKRAALEKATQQQLEIQQSVSNNIANAVIVDRAQVPTNPSSPNRPLLAVMAGILALGAGVGAITLQELLGVGMRSIAEVEQRLRVPLLGSIPRIGKRKDGAKLVNLVIEQPASLYAEALRNLRTSVLGVSPAAHSVVALTSSLPEEGKTTTSLAFARVLAMNGTRTLLIDCDLRKASLRPLIGSAPDAGLVEVLRGTARAEDAIIADRVDGLDLLMTTQPLFTAEGLFGNGRMERLLADLKGRYQTIVLDLPPVMGVADARALSVMADTAVMILRWGSTPPRAAEQALKWLRADGANIVGAVFTMVDPNSEAIGGLFYSNKYAAYYQKA